MPTHDDKQKAGRYLTKGEESTRGSLSATVVAGGLLVTGLVRGDESVLWAGAGVLLAAGVMHGVGELYLQAAKRIMNRQHRR